MKEEEIRQKVEIRLTIKLASFDESISQWRYHLGSSNGQRSTTAMVTVISIFSILVVFRSNKVREHFSIRPTGIASSCPAVEIVPVTYSMSR